jgi:hypothetical protein
MGLYSVIRQFFFGSFPTLCKLLSLGSGLNLEKSVDRACRLSLELFCSLNSIIESVDGKENIESIIALILTSLVYVRFVFPSICWDKNISP